MGLALTVARRSLLQRKGRTLFSILGIAVGIATVVGVYTLDYNTVAGMKRRLTTEWRPELEVRATESVEDPRGELEGVQGVSDVSAFFQHGVVLRRPGSTGREGRAPALLFGADTIAVASMGAYRLLAGADIDPVAEPPQVLLGARTADALGVELGDMLNLSPPPRAVRKACIDGRLQVVDPAVREAPPETTFQVVGVLAEERLGRRAEGEVVLVDYERGLSVFPEARIDSRFWVRRDPKVGIERLRSGLAESFAYDIGRSVVVGEAADESAFRNGVRMAGLLALVLGLYVVFHTLSMSLVERIREVATLHALGTSRGQIARVFFTEALLLAGSGGALGLLGGLWLARTLLEQGITTLGSGRFLPDFEVPWDIALPLALLGVVVALLGSIFPLLRAGRTSTVVALRGEQDLSSSQMARGFHLFAAVLLCGLLPAMYFVIVPVVGEASGLLIGSILMSIGVLALLVVVPLLVPSIIALVCVVIARPFARLWPFAGGMAAHSIRESRRRVAVSTSAIALVVAAFVGLKGMTNSLRGEIEVWADAAVVDKVFVQDLPRVDTEELAEHLRTYPGVLGVEPGSARAFAPFLLLGLDVDELERYGPLAESPELVNALRRGHGVVLSERVARNFGYAVGDVLQVSTGAGRVQEFQVVLISDAYGYFPHPDERMYGVVAQHHMKRYFCLDVETAERVAVRLEPDADPGLVEAAVLAFLQEGGQAPPPEQPVRFETGRELRAFQLADIDRDFQIFDIILGLTALLAGLGVLNGQLLSALERSKELGVLRALGTTRGQIAGMVWLESGVIGLLGGLLGLGLGAGLGPVIVRALETLSGLALPHRTAEEWLWVALSGSLVLALLAGTYPIWSMSRMDAVRAVRTGG